MKTYFERLDYFKRMSMQNVNKIEDITGQMFHDVYPDLAFQHSNAMDVDSCELYKKFKIKTDRLIDQLQGEQ